MNALQRIFRRWNQAIPRTESGTQIRWGKWLRNIAVRLTLWFLSFTVGLTLVYALLPVPFTPLMVIRSLEKPETHGLLNWKKDWAGFHELSPHLQLAVVCAEDQNFFNHLGFDLESIEKAYQHNKKSKRKRGASTISQQTAKNVFLWPNRSWLRKGLEVYFTGLIELLWSKKRIMTVYLNVAEFGDGIYGAEAAARHYFNKSAAQLNRREAALLAAVLPSPRRYSVKKPTPYVVRRQQWILEQMRLWGNHIDFENPVTPTGPGQKQ